MSGNHFLQSFGRVHELSDWLLNCFCFFPVLRERNACRSRRASPIRPSLCDQRNREEGENTAGARDCDYPHALVTDVLDIISANASGAKADVI